MNELNKNPMFFDPDTLIYYFYKNRLKQLWIYSEDEEYEP